VAVAVPTEVCRAKGPEGEFLRSAGIDKHWVTSSGYMSCLSASGKWLGHAPSAKVLEEFRKLPESERKPGAVVVPDLAPSECTIPAPPEGGLVLRVHARFLGRDEQGNLRPATPDDFPLLRGKPSAGQHIQFLLSPNTEYLWLTRKEWQALVPDQPKRGQKLPVPSAISDRMARFHLVPRRALTSEDGILPKSAVRTAELTLTVQDVSAERIQLVLEGFVHTGTDFDPVKATTPNGPLAFGFATPLHGILEYDRGKNTFVRFDLVAPGEVWGRWGDANGNSMSIERPGRSPIGFAFELAQGNSPTDRIPPAGNGNRALRNGYFATGK
jgi:hypothetical protein